MTLAPPILSLAALASLVLLAVAPAQAQAYRPEAQERLNLRVVLSGGETGMIEAWPAISGEYVIDSSGYISVPLAGRVMAAGRPLDEIEAAVGEAIRTEAGLMTAPSVSAEVAEHRPVYVLGDVQTPDAYPFRPGMTVIQAFTLAGGERRVVEELDSYQLQELYRNLASHTQVKMELARLRARAARLEAELAGSETVDFPDLGHPDGARGGEVLMAEETRLFAARQEAVVREEAAYQEIKELLNSEIEALDDKLGSQRRQRESVREAAGNIESLAGRGLATAQRLLDLQRTLTEVEGKLIDLETAKFRARQDLSKAARDLADRQADRELQGERDLQEARAGIEQLLERQAMLRQLIASTGAEPDTARPGDEEVALGFEIMRGAEGAMESIPAGYATALRPGDVVMVSRPSPRPAAAGGVARRARPPAAPAASANGGGRPAS